MVRTINDVNARDPVWEARFEVMGDRDSFTFKLIPQERAQIVGLTTEGLKRVTEPT